MPGSGCWSIFSPSALAAFRASRSRDRNDSRHVLGRSRHRERFPGSGRSSGRRHGAHADTGDEGRLHQALNKWFGALNVLKDITLSVEPREVVVVCGPSGSGKSTLIRCINGLETIRDGDLMVDGQRVGDPAINMTRLRTEIGFVFQSFNLYPHKTALENVTLAPIHVVRFRALRPRRPGASCSPRSALPTRSNAYPAQISGGQHQRVAIARCLGMCPKIMLF
ncbi:MAG: ATP-binding cassette domain-containing protein, partial [Mesorhizobium sp.]